MTAIYENQGSSPVEFDIPTTPGNSRTITVAPGDRIDGPDNKGYRQVYVAAGLTYLGPDGKAAPPAPPPEKTPKPRRTRNKPTKPKDDE